MNNMIGREFGRLKVVRQAESKNKKLAWECLCSCGETVVKVGTDLRKGKIKSCGCLKRELCRAKGKSQTIPMEGKQIGLWKVLEKGKTRNRSGYWKCLCTGCGTVHEVEGNSLRRKDASASRGCRTCCGIKIGAALTTHGLSKERLYNVWTGMIRRCYNRKHVSYLRYGGRGIQVCKEWRESMETFVEWGKNNGWAPGLDLDRIDNDGNYSPENCKFIPRLQNSWNREVSKNRQLPLGVRVTGNKYQSYVNIDGKFYQVGIFSTPEEAAEERRKFLAERGLV